MKTIQKYKTTWLIAMVFLGAMFSNVSNAGLINEDFSDGFNGWSGDVIFYDDNTGIEDEYAEDVDFSLYAGNFFTGLNSVTLRTSFDGFNENWGIFLYQQFEVAANSSLLSLSFLSNADYAFVTLVDENFDLIHDFSDDLTFDISSLVGSKVGFEFGIEDFYNDGIDLSANYLTVSNISLTTTSVPEPSSIALFSLALFMCGRKSFKRQNHI